MKKIIIFLSLFVSTCALAAQVDPLWRLQRALVRPSLSISEIMGVDRALGIEEEALIEVFVKTSDTTLTAERIRNCGGKVRTITRTIITASLPAAVLEGEAAGWTEAEYIEAAKPMSPQNKLANADTGVTTAQAGTELPYGFDGTGVIIGIIDSGIDFTRDAFKTASGKTRILYIWDQEGTTRTPPPEFETSYGTEYTQAQIDAGSVGEKDTDGHGTHVAGTAGGRDTSYSGVAPRANFIIVGNSAHNSTTETDAAYYIFQKAATLGMPAVINISLGSDLGAHDGTSVAEQALDELVSESPGRAIAVSAGNSANPTLDGYLGYAHIGYEITTAIDEGSFFKTSSTGVTIDVWGPQSCDVNIKLGVWNDDGDIPLDESEFVINRGSIGSLDEPAALGTWASYVINRTENSNLENGKWHAYIAVAPNEDYSLDLNRFSIVFHVNSGTCSGFDAWTQPYDEAIFSSSNYIKDGVQYNPGDNDKTVGLPATAANVIAVGAYTTRTDWTDSSGGTHSDSSELVNYLSSFSSIGPAIDPAVQGTKPNITAPGAYLISARSADSSPSGAEIIDAEHVVKAGTSMSSPHVAGIVALMLQAYPLLTYSEIIDYLQNTARSDSYVGTAPNADWGYGKVDALAAVKAVVVGHPSSDESDLTVPGITSGTINTDYTTQEIAVNFPRAVEASTIKASNLYVNTLTTGSSLSQSSAWNPSPCDPGNVISSTVTLTNPLLATITLAEPLGLGDFAVCLSPNVKDTSNATFWGKTVQFGTSLPNTGCSLVRSADRGSSQPFLILFTLVAILSAARLKNILRKRELGTRPPNYF